MPAMCGRYVSPDDGRRCVLPATGFYEWQVQADGRTKRPYYVTANDQEIFGFAGHHAGK
jgi:putative SOS response-associated peptidase YedK